MPVDLLEDITESDPVQAASIFVERSLLELDAGRVASAKSNVEHARAALRKARNHEQLPFIFRTQRPAFTSEDSRRVYKIASSRPCNRPGTHLQSPSGLHVCDTLCEACPVDAKGSCRLLCL